MLINETRFKCRSHLRIIGYEFLTANHPSDRLCRGSVFLAELLNVKLLEILLKTLENFSTNF